MEFEFTAFKLILTVAVVSFLGLVGRLYNAVVLKPEKLRKKLREQGISGPPPKFLLGNLMEMKRSREDAVAKVKSTQSSSVVSHNCGAIVLPVFEDWIEKYGDVVMFGHGPKQVLLVIQPEMVKDMMTCTSIEFGKPSNQAKEWASLLGRGILTSNGPYWAYQRKILAPEFYMDKVKEMFNAITESANIVLETWRDLIDANGGVADIKIDNYLRNFSADVISRVCFGSSYSKGEEIFKCLRALHKVSSEMMFNNMLGMRHVPTRSNREAWALEKKIRKLILEAVKERYEAGHDNDMMQMVLEGARKSDLRIEEIDNFIVDNCKNMYLAGNETTGTGATWCLMLLATNPEWQERVRAEIFEVCKGQPLDADMIRKMKQLNMVVNESLRLYPSTLAVSREALNDMKFGGINVPKGVNIWVLVTKLHTDPENWGPDSHKFNPERFANGISGACKYPHLYMPWGFGPRICIGQHLATLEIKVVIALILTNFSFSISPKYVHSPAMSLILEPGHGVDLLVKKL